MLTKIYLRFLVIDLMLFLLVSCLAEPPLPKKTDSLLLDLTLNQNKVHSVEDISGVVILTNQSNINVLVHRRLFYMPFPGPSDAMEMYIMVSDSSGNLVYMKYFTAKYDLPSENTLSLLKPGEHIERRINLYRGFDTSMFRKGEKYTIVAVYQNDLDVTKTIDGVIVSSWVGSVRSNEETFFILP